MGAQAPHPFADFRQILDDMAPDQKVKAIGGANYKLLKAGVVKWDEIVTKFSVRSLRQVVALNKISVKTMLESGISPAIAKNAYASVHTAEATIIRAERAEQIQKLTDAGVSHQALIDAISRAKVSQVKIIGTTQTHSMAPLVAARPHASELTKILATIERPNAKVVVAPKPPLLPPLPPVAKAPKPPAPPAPATEPEPTTSPTAPAAVPGPIAPVQARVFSSAQEADEWGKRNYSKWEKGLSQSQKNAIEDYRHDAWRELNEGLRTTGVEGLSPSQKKMVKNLDAALAKHPLPEPVTVVRSVDLMSAGIDRSQLKPGAMIIDKGYTSTSLDPNKAWVGQRLEIRLPAGTPAAYVNYVGEGNTTELELLVGREVEQYRIVEVRNDLYRTVVLEAILPAGGTK